MPSSAEDAGTPTGRTAPVQPVRYADLAGKVVLVTGGTGGIGAPLCRTLAAQGARVAVAGRDAAAATGLAAQLGPTALGIAADCTVAGQVAAMRERVVSELGPPDAVVCLAGGALDRRRPDALDHPAAMGRGARQQPHRDVSDRSAACCRS